jgi:hypothetical protein
VEQKPEEPKNGTPKPKDDHEAEFKMRRNKSYKEHVEEFIDIDY